MSAMSAGGRWALPAAILLVGATACAAVGTTFAGYATGPSGISRAQQRQREALASSEFQLLLDRHEDDQLLDALNAGMVRYYASQFERSAAVLDTAALIADDRITASLSKDLLALVTNDVARPYQPGRTERLFVPYYGMLAWARRGAWEDAAVEARRLVSLLALYGSDRDDAERSLHATLHYLAGTVFDRAGDRGEAGVAYRAARSLMPSSSDSVARPLRTGEGELLVIVERGFVAHRTSEEIAFALADERNETHDGDRDGDAHENSNRISYPALRRSARPWGRTVRLRIDDSPTTVPLLVAVIDDGAAADARRERAAIVKRAIARAAAKYALTKAIRDRKGEVAGELAKLGSYLLERADVRSWHLLPQELAVLRLRAPAGVHTLRLELIEGANARRVDVGPVTATDGLVTIVPVRLFRDPPAASPPVLVAAERGDCAKAVCR